MAYLTHYRYQGKIVSRDAAIDHIARGGTVTNNQPDPEDYRAARETLEEAEQQSCAGYWARDGIEDDFPGLTIRHEYEEGY